MDQVTQAQLMNMFVQLLAARGADTSPLVLAEFGDLLARAKDVPPGRFDDAANSLERLVAEMVHTSMARGLNQALYPIDLRDALRSLCPIWPFC